MGFEINISRMMGRLNELGKVGRNSEGRLIRLAGTNEDKAGKDLIKKWMQELNLKIKIDKIGNLFGIWSTEENKNEAPVFTGSHVDTVINAGIFDGALGIIGGLEVIQTMQENGVKPKRPIVLGVFTNEEGILYQPDMMGSLVYAGGMATEEALNIIGNNGKTLKEELKRTGYYGDEDPGFLKPDSFIELHIEQGPILEVEGYSVGAVENLQGISWQKVTCEGVANHAGTTPMYLRKDAGYAASLINVFLHNKADELKTSVATIGKIKFEPDAINVIPSKAEFTVDLRDPNSEKLKKFEAELDLYIEKLKEETNINIKKERLSRFEPVQFDENIVKLIEKAAAKREIKTRRMTSGAGQDAQMIARICPTAMIFVASKDGISHNPKEFSKEEDIENGANILLDVIIELANK